MPTTNNHDNDSFIDRRLSHDADSGITRRGKRLRGAALVAIAASGLYLTTEGGQAAIDHVKASHTVVNPALNDPHKDIRLGETYIEPDGTRVTPTTLWDVSSEVHLPQEQADVLKMLTDQAHEAGYESVGDLPSGYDVRVPLDAQIGEISDPNVQK